MQQGANFIGEVFRRSEAGYEAARRATCRNERLPDRYPDIIVQATSEADVIAAVRLANANGWSVGVRSGGHSWSCNHVRDGGMLLDVSRLDAVTIDRAAILAARGGKRRAGNLLRIEAPRWMLRRVPPDRQCAGHGFGLKMIAEAGLIPKVGAPACGLALRFSEIGVLIHSEPPRCPRSS